MSIRDALEQYLAAHTLGTGSPLHFTIAAASDIYTLAPDGPEDVIREIAPLF